MTFRYKVVVVESERGWGQKQETLYVDTPEKAQKAIDNITNYNNEQWAKTRTVPDWYEQVVGGIEVVEI